MARILLVDDEKIARALYADFLVGAGHEVTAVSSVAEAKAALSDAAFDAVVTDLILPEGDGMEVLQYAKEKSPDSEVVVITALDKVDPAVRAIKSGAAEYLVKPVTPEALQHAVMRSLSTRQLLRENQSLRSHVSLMEAAQRISTTLDRERLHARAISSFTQVTGAKAVVLFSSGADGEPSADAIQGIPADLKEGILAKVAAQLSASLDSPTPLADVPGPFGSGAIIPARDNDQVWGFAVLFFAGDPLDPTYSQAAYLARHLGLAFRNLGRFAAVEDLAYLDDLTHLFNRRYLELVLDREIKSSQQLKTPFSLLFLDLDYFKSVNDTHGHMIGSKLLVEVGRIIKGCVRDLDVVVRYGGDEYVVLLRATDSGGALKVGERIRRTTETHHFLAREGYRLSISTCIGVATFPEHAQDKATLLDMADRAMYRGKKSTRNVIYMAAKGLEATPSNRHHRAPGKP